MKKYISPSVKFIANTYGTRLVFHAEEDGAWFVELNASKPNSLIPRRLRFIFLGATQTRINDDYDQKNSGEYVFRYIEDSEWVASFLHSYIEEYGTALLPAVNDMQHFIVKGHDLSIGILARKVEVIEIAV